MSANLNRCPAAAQKTSVQYVISGFGLYAQIKFPITAKCFHDGPGRMHTCRGTKAWPVRFFTHNVINDTIRDAFILHVSLNHFNLPPQNSISILRPEEHF